MQVADENSYKKFDDARELDSSYPAEPAILRRQPGLCLDLPVLAADGISGIEQVVGIIFLLDGQELLIVRSPEGLLPIWLGRIGLCSEFVSANATGRTSE